MEGEDPSTDFGVSQRKYIKYILLVSLNSWRNVFLYSKTNKETNEAPQAGHTDSKLFPKLSKLVKGKTSAEWKNHGLKNPKKCIQGILQPVDHLAQI